MEGSKKMEASSRMSCPLVRVIVVLVLLLFAPRSVVFEVNKSPIVGFILFWSSFISHGGMTFCEVDAAGGNADL